MFVIHQIINDMTIEEKKNRLEAEINQLIEKFHEAVGDESRITSIEYSSDVYNVDEDGDLIVLYAAVKINVTKRIKADIDYFIHSLRSKGLSDERISSLVIENLRGSR